MGMLDIPSELLEQVIEETLPESFENLMLTCKRVYQVGSRFTPQHQRLKKQYSRTNLCGTAGASGLYWLTEFAKDPRIPYYMTTVDLGRRFDPRSLLGDGQSLREWLAQTDVRSAEAFIRSSPYMTPDAIDSDFWARQILSDVGDPDNYTSHDIFLGIFLLTLLPNVTTLTLPWVVPGRFPFDDDPQRSVDQYTALLELISSRARSDYALRGRAALSNLKCLSYPLEPDYNIRERLAFLGPLLVLPRLEELYAMSLVAVDFHMDFKWTYPDIDSNLRVIEFADCCMDSVGISNLLEHTPHLTTFRYEHVSKHHGLGAYWDAGEFVAAVERHAGNRLEHLAVTVRPGHCNAIEAGVTRMHGFTKLVSLEVDWKIFCGPSIESGEKAGILDTPPRQGYRKWTHLDMPPLRDILPCNIQSLCLFVDPDSPMCKGSLASFLQDLPDSPYVDFPLLRDYSVRQLECDNGAFIHVPTQQQYSESAEGSRWRERFIDRMRINV